MTTKEILIAARAKIADEKNWTQGELARDAKGDPCKPLSPEAVCWCTDGALRFAQGEDNLYARSYGPIGALMEALSLEKDPSTTIPWRYNDSHTHAEVLAIFDRAIAAQS